jgi:gamma-glutamylcyclotransferase (GGCT)/AIG2-like uncharacterized protein YtfP
MPGDTTESKIAVYGTLLRRFDTQRRLGIASHLHFVGPCQFEGALYNLGDYPGAVPGDGEIHGELYRMQTPGRVLPVMDRFEGYDPDRNAHSLFVRRLTPLQTPAGETAWVYWFQNEVEPSARISSGRWPADEDEQGGAP